MKLLSRRLLTTAAFTLLAANMACAAPITLFEHAVNIDGTVSTAGAMPSSVNTTAFDSATGLGRLTIKVSGSGSHNVALFVDHEIDETINTFFNESGSRSGVAAIGQSWEIDEPGFVFGDIYDNFVLGTLDGSNAVGAGSEDDVSMALAWAFALDVGQEALIDFFVSDVTPGSGFHLSQFDPDSSRALHFWSTLTVRDEGTQVPEPASLPVAALGLGLLALLRRRRRWTMGAAAAAAVLALPAQAAAPVARTVPWVASNPLIAHTTYAGRTVRLKGASDLQGASIQYTWDFGDGSAPAVGTVANRYVIEASHQYVGAPGMVWTARLTLMNLATGESSSKPYFVEMKAKTLEAEANVAIDEGLWYLHKTQLRNIGGCGECGNWQSGGYASSGYHGVSFANLNAFMVNGHQEGGSADNPYTETVARGMRFLFTQLAARGIGPQSDPLNGGSYNPDTNGNGLGLYNPQNEAYQTGMLLSALVATGTPNAVAPTGPANVIGRRYIDIAQDLVDNIAYCQYGGATGGGWYYSCNGSNDNSISQWMAIGLLGARSFGAQLPQHPGTAQPNVVPAWNRVWLRNSQVAPNPPAYNNGGGYFGYQNTGTVWGPYATTASGMVQLVMDGIGRGSSPAAGPNWEGAETFMRENWDNDVTNPGDAYNSIKDYYYGLFSFTKSMLLHDPTGSGAPSPIRCFQSFRVGTPKKPIDWYGAERGLPDSCSGTPASSHGVARTLVNDQNAVDGYWSGHNVATDQYPFETAWAIMMLNRTVFESGAPVAVARAVPNPALMGVPVTFDGADSFHQDAARRIDSWQWDFDNDGVWDATGPVVSRSFPALGTYTVTLRVTDDGSAEKAATTTLALQVSLPPMPPSANANGPYNFCPATPNWFLDGSASVNPDQGLSEPGRPGDTIQSHLWDLNGDGNFGDASGPTPSVKAALQALGIGSHLVQLKVTDTTATAFPSSGLGNQSSVSSATVNVRAADDPACGCIANLAARPKAGKVQLTWSPFAGAAAYNVYRATLNGGPYQKIGTTASAYATFLDTPVPNGTAYYYVVRSAAPNLDELCQSNQAAATATPR